MPSFQELKAMYWVTAGKHKKIKIVATTTQSNHFDAHNLAADLHLHSYGHHLDFFDLPAGTPGYVPIKNPIRWVRWGNSHWPK